MTLMKKKKRRSGMTFMRKKPKILWNGLNEKETENSLE